MENLKEQKKQFDKLILGSVNNNHIIKNTVFYDNSYKKQLCAELKKRHLFEKYSKRELQEVTKGSGLIKMCSVASSSRLCFIYFAEDNNLEMEQSLNTGTRGNAQLDAAKDNLFYECKCHEIFDNHDTVNNHLRLAYKRNLQKYFGINYQEKNENYCKLTLKDFGIENDESIYKLHFDMKQFLCHLFGIANNGGGTLQYIFFTPKKELIKSNQFCKDIYKALKEEIESIWRSESIRKMCQDNNIKLPKPLMVEVSTINDIVFQNI
ncbi:MAG: hypothetical protein IKX70_02065 [Treponema sp.]|nr:hypothetical protein [Treponema sp.]